MKIFSQADSSDSADFSDFSKNLNKNTPYHKQLEKFLKYLSQKKVRPKLLLHACCGPCSSYVLEYLSDFFDITIYYYNPNIFPPQEYERRLNELETFLPRFEKAVKNKVKLVKAPYNPQEFYDALDLENHKEFILEKEKGERCARCYELRLKKSYLYAKENNFDFLCTTLSISPFKDSKKINEIGKRLCSMLMVEDFESTTLQNSAASSSAQAVLSANPAATSLAQAALSANPATSSLAQATASDDISDASATLAVVSSAQAVLQWLPSDFKKNGGFQRSLELSKEFNLYRQQYCGCVFSKTNTEKEKQNLAQK